MGATSSEPTTSRSNEARESDSSKRRKLDDTEGGKIETEDSLFERLGGEPAVTAVVDLFYADLLDNPETAPFFSGMNMTSHKKSVGRFLQMAFGAPVEYKGPNMTSAHLRARGKGLTMHHFLLAAGSLEKVLTVAGVPQELQTEVLAMFCGLAPQMFPPNITSNL